MKYSIRQKFLIKFVFILLLSIIFLFVFSSTKLRAQSGDQKPILEFSKKTIWEEEPYQLSITSHPNYQGKINVKSFKCEYEYPSRCTAENIQADWGPNGGWLFTNGTAQITPVAVATYGFYHMKFQIPGNSLWSDEYILTVIPKQATETYMINTTNDLFIDIDTRFPIENLVGLDPHDNGLNTIAKVEQNYPDASQVDLANLTVELLAGNLPSCSTSDKDCRESNADWRKKSAARHLMLADYYTWRILTKSDQLSQSQINQLKEKIGTHAYHVLLHLDILSSLPKHGTIASLNPDYQNQDQRYTLADTYNAQRYLPDFGMGGLKGLSIIMTKGLLPETVCSYYERFNSDNLSTDSKGKPCRVINLKQRMAQVASAIAVSVATRWVYTGPLTYRQEYGNDPLFWEKIKQGQSGYGASPNNNNPNIIDLNNRNYIVSSPITQFMRPNTYAWQMSGMTLAADIVLKLATLSDQQKDLYTFIKQWGTEAVAYELAMESTNKFGFTTKGMLNDYCDGTTTTSLFDQQLISDCVGGSTEYYACFSDSLHYEAPALLGDNWQHLGVIMFANDWSNLPSDYQKTALDKKIVFVRSIWKDDEPFIDFTNGTFNYATLSKYWPNSICSCSQTSPNCKYYYQDIGGIKKVVGSANEYASDYVISAVPPYYRMMEILGRHDDAKYLLGYNYLIYQALKNNPPDPTIEICGDDSRFAGGNTKLGSVLRYATFYFQTAYPAWNKISLSYSGGNSCTPVGNDANINHLITWYSSYRNRTTTGDLDCSGTVDINDLIFWYTKYRNQ